MAPSQKKKASRARKNASHAITPPEYLNQTQNIVHPEWEIIDPTPDVHAMFMRFNGKFFNDSLGAVMVEWSKRMFSCAGICYMRSNRYSKTIIIRLSEPLLKLRPRKDLVETLLHEMIHAYYFVLNVREDNGGHGPQFKRMMNLINQVAGTNITVYHTFNDEVAAYKTHVWRCNGICQFHSPFHGFVNRTSNRAPGPNDQWWERHHRKCGGTFLKSENEAKHRRISTNNDANAEAEVTWELYDDDVMVANVAIPCITILDSDDENDPQVANLNTSKGTQSHNKRTIRIKREIMEDESSSYSEDDITMIDDDYDDVTAATELANESVFHKDDSINCPICFEKLLRSELSNHLEGCSITIKVPPPRFAPKSRAKKTRASKPGTTSQHASSARRRRQRHNSKNFGNLPFKRSSR